MGQLRLRVDTQGHTGEYMTQSEFELGTGLILIPEGLSNFTLLKAIPQFNPPLTHQAASWRKCFCSSCPLLQVGYEPPFNLPNSIDPSQPNFLEGSYAHHYTTPLRQPNFLNAENQAQKKPVMSKYQKKF